MNPKDCFSHFLKTTLLGIWLGLATPLFAQQVPPDCTGAPIDRTGSSTAPAPVAPPVDSGPTPLSGERDCNCALDWKWCSPPSCQGLGLATVLAKRCSNDTQSIRNGCPSIETEVLVPADCTLSGNEMSCKQLNNVPPRSAQGLLYDEECRKCLGKLITTGADGKPVTTRIQQCEVTKKIEFKPTRARVLSDGSCQFTGAVEGLEVDGSCEPSPTGCTGSCTQTLVRYNYKKKECKSVPDQSRSYNCAEGGITDRVYDGGKIDRRDF